MLVTLEIFLGKIRGKRYTQGGKGGGSEDLLE